MGEYRTQEAYFELPPGWLDASINTLEYPRPEGKLRLIVTRIPSGKDTLAKLVDDRLVEQRRRLPFFELIERQEKTISNTACSEIAIGFRDGETPMLQRAVSFLIGSRLVVFAAMGKRAQEAEVTALLGRALDSLEVRRSGVRSDTEQGG